jgi:hypothetical protein
MKAEQREALLNTLKLRFEQNMNRHAGVDWADVHARLQRSPEKLMSLHEMERTGGEPDVIGAADEKRTSRRTTLSTWPRPWVSRY